MKTLQKTAGLLAPAFVSAALAAASSGQRAEALVWADEFDGTALDLTKWSYQTGDGSQFGIPGWGNNELQSYRDGTANAVVSDGTLKITAKRENFGNASYTSARLRSLGKGDFLYGRIESRMKLPSTRGIWPAFWMLPTDSPYGGWAAGGEIDIMESVNIAERVYGTIHFGGPWPQNTSRGTLYANGTDFSQGFHTYAIEWGPDEIRWFVDGLNFQTLDTDDWFSTNGPGNPRAPFDSPFHLLLNVAVGGNFPGNPDGSSQFPQTLEVDYVRVYQLQRQPFGGAPAAIPGVVEAEDFDEGYPGETYIDANIGNNGGVYRPNDDVDIEPTTGGGFNVGWIEFGEQMQYTVDVQQAGEYTVTARVASPSTGGVFGLSQDGAPIGLAFVPVTGGFQTWQDVTFTVSLDAGEQVITFENLSPPTDEYNMDRMSFELVGGACRADVNRDGVLDSGDFFAWIVAFGDQAPECDQNDDQACDGGDFFAWVAAFSDGCG
ncbi:MAG: family 16 glycosylhydrolase [Planctomycetota bacterium]